MSNYQTIDIRDLKQKTKKELHDAIVEAVKDTQRVLVRDLPNELVMNQAQFDLLKNDPEMQPSYVQSMFVYLTPLNAMDVIIK